MWARFKGIVEYLRAGKSREPCPLQALREEMNGGGFLTGAVVLIERQSQYEVIWQGACCGDKYLDSILLLLFSLLLVPLIVKTQLKARGQSSPQRLASGGHRASRLCLLMPRSANERFRCQSEFFGSFLEVLITSPDTWYFKISWGSFCGGRFVFMLPRNQWTL